MGGVQGGRALAYAGHPFVPGQLRAQGFSLARLHPLHDDDQFLDQLFEVEGPVLVLQVEWRGGGGIHAGMQSGRRGRWRESERKGLRWGNMQADGGGKTFFVALGGSFLDEG